MSKIFITGDTHIPIDVSKLNTHKWPEQKLLTKDDYLIVCGDFGLLWNWKETAVSLPGLTYDECWTGEEAFWYKWLNNKPFTTLWVDGNHENFDRLNKYPVTEWNGGKVHMISNSIIHLMRGQVFTIGNKTLFTMGGAKSHDRGPATGTEKADAHKTWWKEETPLKKEWTEAGKNLKAHNHKVDYIITHEAPGNVTMNLGRGVNEISNKLWEIRDTTDFDRWYCGHHHVDALMGKVRILYDDIIEAGE